MRRRMLCKIRVRTSKTGPDQGCTTVGPFISHGLTCRQWRSQREEVHVPLVVGEILKNHSETRTVFTTVQRVNTVL